MRRLIVILGIAMSITACASSSTRTGDGLNNTATARSTTNRDNLITADEITATRGAVTAADLVRMLRPRWRPARVFVGNAEYGGRLADISVGSVREIQFLTAPEAQMRFGMRVQEVILVTRK